MCVNELLRSAMQSAHEAPRFAYIAPYLKQAKDIAWDYVHKYAGVIPGAVFNESELRVDVGPRRLRLYGADNPDSIQGIYLDGVVLDEYQLIPPRLFGQIVRPMLADRKGWVCFAGKPLGHNHLYKLYHTMHADPTRLTRLYRASETGVLSDEELRDMRVGPPPMSDDEYAQELECSWEAAIPGAFYSRELERARADGRIRVVPWEPLAAVDTWWDLGFSDTTAILFTQMVGREVHVLDYLEDDHKDFSFYATALQRREYRYGEHVLPHDAASEMLGTRAMVSLFKDLHVPGHVRVLPVSDVAPGIEAAKRLFARCWFDETKCALLLEALASYHSEYDPKVETFKLKPKHDWASHGADAFRYLAVGHRGVTQTERPRVYTAKTGPPPMPLSRPQSAQHSYVARH